mmetsp:Transcript_26014/g.73156  ORF Transcript_26014/g.73156 Transcript_26014/m.73156 type:complete len:637 (-) Transcript_26014:134-2044(-)
MSSSGYGYGDTKRRRGHSRSRSPVESRRNDEKRPKGDKKKKDKKGGRAEEDPARRKRSRDDRDDRRAVDDRGSNHSTPQVAPASQPEEAVLGRTPSRVAVPGQLPEKHVSKWREEMAKEAKPNKNDEEVKAVVNKEEDSEDDEAAIERTLTESRARREALMAKWVNRGEGENGGVSLDTPMTGMGEEDDEDDGGEEDGEERHPVEPRAEVNEETIKAKKDLMRFILSNKAEHDDDMFNEDADEEALKSKRESSQAIGQTGASADDWDDSEGYYRAKIGEIMDDRYLVTEDKCGQGVFSNVAKATDQETKMQVAIKIMRCNDMMRQAAEKEVEILERINKADKGNKRHCIRLLRHFIYRGHMCLVFECMWDNLRVALKKYTKDRGMSLQAVRAYTKQLLIALRHIHRCNIIHADIKPDNILISAGHNVVKICDLGSGMDLIEVEVTPYLVSRFYRAPEIVLGKEYGVNIDTFAMGCSMFELFTGKILFPGRTNNDMLRLFMEVKGKIPHKVLKSGTTWKQHFDDNLDFKYFDTNKATRKKITRVITDFRQKRTILEMIMARVGPDKQKSDKPEDTLYVKKAKQFADLMEKMTAFDPERRISPHEALSHPFLVEAFGSAIPGGGGGDKSKKPGGVAKK